MYIYIYILGRWNMHRIYGEVCLGARPSSLFPLPSSLFPLPSSLLLPRPDSRVAFARLLSCWLGSCGVGCALLLLHAPLLLCSLLGCNKSLLSCCRGSSLVAGSHLCSLESCNTLALGVDTLVDSLLSSLESKCLDT
jgi:hypothetical protein